MAGFFLENEFDPLFGSNLCNVFFFAAERARYADIRCSANFKLVLSNNLKKNDNANWNNYTQKIDHEDNERLTHAEILKSKIDLWLDF